MKPVENGDAENLRINLLTQEIKFAKMLAGNVFDGAIKEKHIDKLGIWLKDRAACTESKNMKIILISKFEQKFNNIVNKYIFV